MENFQCQTDEKGQSEELKSTSGKFLARRAARKGSSSLIHYFTGKQSDTKCQGSLACQLS
jgi:hypothetical protein